MSHSRLIGELRELCRTRVLEEKWLLAPSRRIGFQWLDQVARSGVPVLNVRVKTLRYVATEIASAEMLRLGGSCISNVRAEVVVDRLFRRLKETGEGYLSSLEPSVRLIRAIHNSIKDLRLAGVCPDDIEETSCEVPAKARDLKRVLAEYEAALDRERLLDYADVLRIAAERLGRDPSLVQENVLVLLPEDMERRFHRLERAVWESLPENTRRLLDVDRAGPVQQEDATDLSLLRWIRAPADAPPPKGDGTARIFRSVGEVNEIREILRRCMEESIPFDEVEILYTDRASYIPLLYDIAWSLKGDDEPLPVTFAEGIPPRYSRPARALMGWTEWIRLDYPQTTLVRMIQDGLLNVEQPHDGKLSFVRLGALLRAVPIGNGRERYLTCLDGALRALEETAGDGRWLWELDAGGEDERPVFDRGDLGRRIEGLRAVRALVADLLSLTPEQGLDGSGILLGALDILEKHARCVNQFDQYTREQLAREIRHLADCLEGEDSHGFDLPARLKDLCDSSHVFGLGPRPGCIYAAPFLSGGHSGRRHTFIVGLDDTRFPGAGLQDPLLLDAERSRISSHLMTAAGRLAEDMEDFARLVARLRGNVTLSYCSRCLQDDREMFPSPVLLAAYRVLSGNHDGDQHEMLQWLPPASSCVPATTGRCIDHTEWWVRRMCGDEAVGNPERLIADHFPHLGRGLKARAARESDRFTEYDGYVPRAGKLFDAARASAPIVSASMLETLGSCPMEYFFKYVLDIEPPEEYTIDPKRWLDPSEQGRLLHSVFREFMSRLRDDGRLPVVQRDYTLMQEILDAHVTVWRSRRPPPSRDVFERAVRDLHAAARIFLLEEERYCKGSSPFCFEAALGVPPEGKGTVLDTPEPVEIPLGGNRILRARGRIDRVDEMPSTQGRRFAVWDYKTGSTWKYKERRARGKGAERHVPFHQGRLVQAVLYRALVEARLRETVTPDACAECFGYFFPNRREHGDRILWSSQELAQGTRLLESLCDMIEKGCFPFTDNIDDARVSDYLDAFGDLASAGEAIRRKLAAGVSEALAPFRELRGYGRKEEEQQEEE